MNDKTITLTLSLNEVNGILGGLAAQPYSQVVELIAKIRQQATEQLQEPTPS